MLIVNVLFWESLWVSMCEEKLMQYIYKSKFSNSPSHVYEILHKKFLIHQGSAGTGTGLLVDPLLWLTRHVLNVENLRNILG